MRDMKRAFLGGATFVVVVVVLSWSSIGHRAASAAGSAPVTVVNTPLSTTVTNAVGISTTANTVKVVNAPGPDPLLVRFEEPALAAVQYSCGGSISSGSDIGGCRLEGNSESVVPAGKRLVIENVSVHLKVPQGTPFWVDFTTALKDGTTRLHEIPMTLACLNDGTGPSIYNASMATRLYADHDDSGQNSPWLAVRLPQYLVSGFVKWTVSGYLVPLP